MDRLLQPVSFSGWGREMLKTREKRGRRNKCPMQKLKVSDKPGQGRFCIPDGGPGKQRKRGDGATPEDAQQPRVPASRPPDRLPSLVGEKR